MTNKNQEEAVPKIIWAALLSSHLIFTYMAIDFFKKEAFKFDQTALLALGGMALISGVMSQFFRVKSYSAQSLKLFFSPFVISMALAESVHIYGLIGIIAGFIDLSHYYYFLAGGILLHLFCFPRLDKIGKKSF